MTPPNRRSLAWSTLVAGSFATVLVSLSIHIVMLQTFGVPFPDRTAVSIWPRLLDAGLASYALIVFHDLAQPRLASFSVWLRALIVAALYATLKEVFRGIAMSGIVTTAFAFGAAKALIPILHSIVLGALVVAVAPRLHAGWMKLIGALGIAATILFAVRPIMERALTPFLQSIAYLDHADVYPFPYGVHVLAWAYLTYLEPVVATLVIAMLVWPALSPRPLVRLLQFVALVMFIKGSIIPTLLYGFYDRAGFARGMLSESQFLLETLALALMTGMIWPRFERLHAAARQSLGPHPS